MRQKAITLACSILLLSASFAAAQGATLTGHVVDASGGSVPGAAVVLRNTETSASTEAITNNDGIFSFPSTRPGAYELNLTLTGFSPFTLQGLRLEVGERRNVDVKLEAARLEQTVTVTAAATPLSTARAERSVVVESQFVTGIPLNIRNPLQMINMAVGVAPAFTDSGNNTFSQSRTNTFRINGAKASTTDIQMDGAAEWGLVYRSNHLTNLTAADYRQLNALGIKLVCDLRTDGERKRSPTTWQGVPAPEIMAASVLKDTDVVLTPERLKEIAVPRVANALTDSYSRMVTEFPEQYGRVLRRLATGPLPSVTHCTAGKDRTGVFSAVLLTILGVPRNLVMLSEAQ